MLQYFNCFTFILPVSLLWLYHFSWVKHCCWDWRGRHELHSGHDVSWCAHIWYFNLKELNEIQQWHSVTRNLSTQNVTTDMLVTNDMLVTTDVGHK